MSAGDFQRWSMFLGGGCPEGDWPLRGQIPDQIAPSAKSHGDVKRPDSAEVSSIELLTSSGRCGAAAGQPGVADFTETLVAIPEDQYPRHFQKTHSCFVTA